MSMIPNEVVVWQFAGKPGNVRSQNTYTTNSGYSLQCSTNNEYLTYGKEPLGINLVWAQHGTDKKIHLRLPDQKERDLLTGEAFALGLGGGDAFLYYHDRTLGVNLDWSGAPKYEWAICGADGKTGVPIAVGQSYAMVNKNVKPTPDFFIYVDRVPGQADVGWTSSPNWPGKILSLVSKYKSEAAALAALI